VSEKELDKNVTNATGGQGSFDSDAEFDELVKAIHQHYESSHDTTPENVETGASLLSGTTISGNSAIHTGNESTLSFFDGSSLTANTTGDANTVDGEHASAFADANHGNGAHNVNYLDSNDYTPESDTHSRYTDGEAVGALSSADAIPFPSYPTKGDVPNISEGEVVYVSGDAALYVEDGN
jgi:hypothetical protein